MADVLATFTGVDANTLGAADTGQDFTVFLGSISRVANRAVPQTKGSFGGYDAGPFGMDGSVSADLGTGAGYAIIFRIANATNWWRAYFRQYAYQVQTGSQQVFSHYETQTVGYTPVEYEYVQTYSGFVGSDGTHHGNTAQFHGNITPLYAWSTNPSLTEISFETYSHNHTHTAVSGSFFTAHYVQNDGPARRTGSTRGGEPITQQVAVYRQEPTYETRQGFDLRLERTVNGTPTTVGTASLAEAPTRLSVVLAKTSIRVFVNNAATAAISQTDSTHSTATVHGFGYAQDTETAMGSGFDNFRVTLTSGSRGLAMVI